MEMHREWWKDNYLSRDRQTNGISPLNRQRRTGILLEQKYFQGTGTIDNGPRLARLGFSVEFLKSFDFFACDADRSDAGTCPFRQDRLDLFVGDIRDYISKPVNMDYVTLDTVLCSLWHGNIQLCVVRNLIAKVA